MLIAMKKGKGISLSWITELPCVMATLKVRL